MFSVSECTTIAHRRSLAVFTADEGVVGNSAARTIFTHFLRRRNRGSLAIYFAEEIAHLGASKNRGDFLGSGKNRHRSRRESHDFGALSPADQSFIKTKSSDFLFPLQPPPPIPTNLQVRFVTLIAIQNFFFLIFSSNLPENYALKNGGDFW